MRCSRVRSGCRRSYRNVERDEQSEGSGRSAAGKDTGSAPSGRVPRPNRVGKGTNLRRGPLGFRPPGRRPSGLWTTPGSPRAPVQQSPSSGAVLATPARETRGGGRLHRSSGPCQLEEGGQRRRAPFGTIRMRRTAAESGPRGIPLANGPSPPHKESGSQPTPDVGAPPVLWRAWTSGLAKEASCARTPRVHQGRPLLGARPAAQRLREDHVFL